MVRQTKKHNTLVRFYDYNILHLIDSFAEAAESSIKFMNPSAL